MEFEEPLCLDGPVADFVLLAYRSAHDSKAHAELSETKIRTLENDEEVAKLKETLNHKLSTFQAISKAMRETHKEELTTALAAHESKVEQKDQYHEKQMDMFRTELTIQHGKITAQNDMYAAQQAENAALKTAITAQKVELAAQNAKIVAQTAEIAAQTAQIAAHNAKLEGWMSGLPQHDQGLVKYGKLLEASLKSACQQPPAASKTGSNRGHLGWVRGAVRVVGTALMVPTALCAAAGLGVLLSKQLSRGRTPDVGPLSRSKGDSSSGQKD